MNYPFMPEQASEFAKQVDAIFFVLTGLTILFTVIVLSFLIFLAVRYRAGNDVNRFQPRHSKWHSLLEVGWSLPPLFLGLAVFVWAAIPYTYIYKPKKDAIEIYVVGKRWMWHIQHANGVRENNELHVPVGKDIQLNLISQDVIHGFFVPAFRIKRDALPGRFNTMWFTPTKVGTYHLFCSEYCGTQHSEMIGKVYVMEPKDYQAWLASGGEKVVAAHQTMEALGQEIYDKMACGSCHDKDGIGRGPVLTGIYGTKVKTRDGSIKTVDNNYLRDAILNPSDDIVEKYQQIMPSYKGQLSEEQVLQLIAYIKSLDTVARTTSSAAPVKDTKEVPGTTAGMSTLDRQPVMPGTANANTAYPDTGKPNGNM